MMVNTSPEYKAAIQENMRGSMEFRASVRIEDIPFRNAATLTDNGHLSFSNVQELKSDVRPQLVNATAETNMYILDGTQKLLPAAPEFQGFVSSAVSLNTGLFSTNPVITITSSALSYDLFGLTLEFDSFNNDYATAFTIQYYYNTTLRKTITVSDNQSPFFMSEERADAVNRIVLTFTKTHNPDRRLRLLDIAFGITRIFVSDGRDGIVSMAHKTMIHPLMKEAPQIELIFEKADPDMEYDPENPAGIWRYMMAGQRVDWSYLFNISEIQQETIPGGKFYLKNPPTTSGENTKFATTGLLQTLTMEYNEGLYAAAGRTYYDLFTDVFTFADIPLDETGGVVWKLDERLKNYRCYLPLPNKSVVNLIQILCQNTASVVDEDTNGYLYVKLNNAAISGNTLYLTTATEYPNYDPKLPPLRNMLFDRHAVTVEAAATELHSSTQVISGTKVITVTYAASTGQSATVTGGTLNTAATKYFAYGCQLTITANNVTVSIKVTGRKLVFAKTQRIYSINQTGDDAPIAMELLSDDALCDALAVVYAKYLQENKRYKFNYLGDPARRANDLFPIDTRFATNLPAQVLSSEYSFNNGSSGVLELKDFG